MPRLTPTERSVRAGRFTASEIAKLVTYARSSASQKKKQWGATALGYIHQKFEEQITGKPIDGYSGGVATDYGHLHEPYACRFFELEYGLVIDDIGFQPYGDDAGATPDGFIKSLNATAQIKCPYMIHVHKKYIEKIKDVADLKKVSKVYYWQMVFEMICTGVNKSVFISYNPKHNEHPLHVVDVPLLKDDKDEILEALDLAIAYKEKLIRTYRRIYYPDQILNIAV